MKTTVDELERRARILQPGFEQYVIEWHSNKARVKSFSSEKVWDVSIMLGTEEGERRVICTCPATKLCHHIVAFYAVAKGITSMRTDKDVTESAGESTVGHDEGTQSLPEPTADGRKMIAAAIEMLVNGIALIITERMKEE